MKKIILSTITFVFLSCSNDNPNPTPQSYNIDTSVDIFLKNSANENLLNTENYNSENFRIYNEINGEKVEVYNPLADAPRNFLIITETSPVSMRLFLNNSITESFPKTYVKWNEEDTDTLKAYIYRTENLIQCKKLWLNDALIWDETTSSNTGRRITITK